MRADRSPLLYKLSQLTTPFGIYQFGKGSQPDPSFGYALDDQARALIIANEFKDENLKKIYLQYIIRSRRTDGLLYQFCDDKGNFLDNNSLEQTQAAQDAYGETLWAILKTGYYQTEPFKTMIENILNYAQGWEVLRPMAYTLIGLSSLLKPHPLENSFLEKLIKRFEENSSNKWLWFENSLTYANAIFPWALWEVALSRKNPKAREIATKTTNFLIQTCQINGIPSPIGNEGWHKRNGPKAVYGQQPIDAAYMVCCLEKAYSATNNKKYLNWAKKWWDWFFGNNINKASLVDENFACYDGLIPNGLNKNQGAESNICFLMAYLSVKRMNL